ncbi:hypothetical protein [Chryseolinea soli]|uniref:Uncharacterized protein n=1 Tax=Chryseolinea soli TaxID=2321403 RepID=A0A385SNX5_9BACT|nr:hypothetical protein [Chryseolinea soli]AYB32226.1 hypothetical protein D4L85_17335 [Chryseolinea soli]
MNHRGRFQAQGVALEESESWSQMEALYYDEGKSLLDSLEAKLSKKDRLMRTLGFQQCHKCIEQASQNGGICVKEMGKPFIKSFPKSYRERVDLEVRLGIAFIIRPKERV